MTFRRQPARADGDAPASAHAGSHNLLIVNDYLASKKIVQKVLAR
jgi:hypothetical protein